MDPKPCVDCGRQYGHLDLCRVKELHECLDRTIALYGPECVAIFHSMVMEGEGSGALSIEIPAGALRQKEELNG